MLLSTSAGPSTRCSIDRSIESQQWLTALRHPCHSQCLSEAEEDRDRWSYRVYRGIVYANILEGCLSSSGRISKVYRRRPNYARREL